MRDKNFDVDLLKTLNDQPMPENPLTDDEFTRVLDAACGRLPQKKPAGHRRFPWGRVAAAAAACLAVGLGDRKSTRLNSSHITRSRMPSSA